MLSKKVASDMLTGARVYRMKLFTCQATIMLFMQDAKLLAAGHINFYP